MGIKKEWMKGSGMLCFVQFRQWSTLKNNERMYVVYILVRKVTRMCGILTFFKITFIGVEISFPIELEEHLTIQFYLQLLVFSPSDVRRGNLQKWLYSID